MEQFIQIIGAVLILTAFAAAQFDRLDQHSITYLVLNLVGAMILATLAAIEHQYGFLLLEGVWTLVSAWALAGQLRGRPAPEDDAEPA